MASVWGELKRRNVVRVAVAYVIIAWLILQVGDTLAPALRLTDWVNTVLAFFLILGFPMALFFAWAFELTPDGIKKEKDVDRSESVTHLTGRKLDYLIIGVLMVALSYFAYDKFVLSSAREMAKEEAATESEPQATAVAKKLSIAVLPFANMSEDPNQEHFADGLAEELLNSLAALGDLRVVSRTSSFAFKDRNVSIAEIAAALEVDHILEGSVRRAGNTIRITAQLIDTSSDSHLWSNSYDRELNLDNILDIQGEIAGKVVNALNLRLLPQDSTMLTANGPANLEALDLYHDGMFYLRKIETGQTNFDKKAFEPAVKNFKASIAADPDWVPPRAALGRTYHFGHSILGDFDRAENMRIAKGHVTDAIRLDDDYGPAYGSLGYILTMAGDFDGAMQALDRARSLNVDISWGKAILMIGLGRYEVAIDEYRNAVNHDPLSTIIRIQLVEAYQCAGRYADVIEAIEGDDELDASELLFRYARILQSEAYIRAGDVERGLQLAVSVAEETGDDLAVAVNFALAGREERARDILNSREVAETRPLLLAATVAAALGEEDRTLTMLEQAADLASSEAWPFIVLWQIQCSPEIRNLSGNPRYKALLDRLGLPD